MALNTIEIDLNKDSKRPMFIVETDTGYATCLLDTGAFMPVWCESIDSLKTTFPNAKRTERNLVTLISGFGSEENDLSEIWEIPALSFNARSNDNTLVYNKVLVAILPKESFSFSMILPATMFSMMNYKIVNIRDKYLEISFENNRPYQVSPVFKVNDIYIKFRQAISSRDKELIEALQEGRLIGSISLFSQDDFDIPTIDF